MGYSYVYIPLILIFIVVIFLWIKSEKVKTAAFKLELASIIFGGVVALYSLILAFVVIVVWQQYQTTGDRVEAEASSLYNVLRSTYSFRDTGRAENAENVVVAKKIKTDIDSYYYCVINYEWKAIETENPDSDILKKAVLTQMINDTIWKDIRQLNPVTEAQKIWYTEGVRNLYKFAEARHYRMANKDYHLPVVMWWMLVAGASVVILFSMFLESESTKKYHHLFKVLMISVMIIFSLLLVKMLNHPFNGTMRLSSDPFSKEKLKVGNR